MLSIQTIAERNCFKSLYIASLSPSDQSIDPEGEVSGHMGHYIF